MFLLLSFMYPFLILCYHPFLYFFYFALYYHFFLVWVLLNSIHVIKDGSDSAVGMVVRQSLPKSIQLSKTIKRLDFKGSFTIAGDGNSKGHSLLQEMILCVSISLYFALVSLFPFKKTMNSDISFEKLPEFRLSSLILVLLMQVSPVHKDRKHESVGYFQGLCEEPACISGGNS